MCVCVRLFGEGSAASETVPLWYRRYEDYDAGKLVDCYLNLPEVQVRFARYRCNTAATATYGKARLVACGAGCCSGRPCDDAPPGRRLHPYICTTPPAVASTLDGPTMAPPPLPFACPQAALGVAPGLEFQSCSDAVGEALGGDVMRSVKALLPDLLAAYPLLLYQGE